MPLAGKGNTLAGQDAPVPQTDSHSAGKVPSSSKENKNTDEEANAYKERQKATMAGLKVGQRDINNDEIIKIYAKDSQFIIYEIKTTNLSDSLRTYIHTIVEEDTKLANEYNKIRSSIADAKSVMYKVLDPVVFKGRIAHLISHALNGNENVKAQFEELITEVNNEYIEQFRHRSNYLLTALVIVVFNIVISTLVYSEWISLSKQLKLETKA